MGKIIDLSGVKFGRLLVIERNGIIDGHAAWKCICECGNETTINGRNLRSGLTRSCGCYRKEILADRSVTHGKSKTRLYRILHNMISRCDNPNVPCYEYYGGRGITVCDEWEKDFQSFYNWAILSGYKDNLTIDRIDVNKNYEPSNCRWVTMKEQSNNRRKRSKNRKKV